MATMVEELTALKDLLNQGILTQEEFEAKKAEVLSRNAVIQRQGVQPTHSTQNTGPAMPMPQTCQTPPQTTPTGASTANTFVPPADSKSKIAAGLLAIFLGTLGIHKFYLGYTQAGIIMLLVSLLGSLLIIGPLVMGVIALIEGIIYLTKTDEQFYLTYVVGRKPWF